MGLSIITTPRELWKFGTHERDTRGSPLYLVGQVSVGVGGFAYTTLRRAGASVGYAVTAGKTLLLTRLLFKSTTPSQILFPGYSDVDLGVDSAADGANAVTLESHASNMAALLVTLAAHTIYDRDCYYEIPATKFPRFWSVNNGTNFSFSVFGHEV